MKLNIGSGKPRGKYRSEEWINIDVHEISGAIKLDVFDMPGEWTNYFDEVHAIHCLEHVNRNRRQEFVDACYRVTKPGSFCYIEVPDFEAVIHDLSDAMYRGELDLEHRMTTSVFGKQRYPGDQHCWGFTDRTLTELCKKAGFDVTVYWNSDKDEMISAHYKMEPILLAQCHKKKR